MLALRKWLELNEYHNKYLIIGLLSPSHYKIKALQIKNELVVLFALSALSAVPVYAFQDIPIDGTEPAPQLPFPKTPRGIQEYANQQNWGSRVKVTFSDIGDRSVLNTPCWHMPNVKEIWCGGGYAEITDPLGTKVCELDKMFGLEYNYKTKRMAYKAERCSS